MNIRHAWNFCIMGGVFVLAQMAAAQGFAADQSGVPALPVVDQTRDATLWQTLVAGGEVMIVIALLSIAAVAIIVYDFIHLNPEKMAPRKAYQDILKHLEARNLKSARAVCVKDTNNIVAKVAFVGIERTIKSPGDPLIKEAMEHRARIEIGSLWQNLNYLADIVTVAPLLGLLGTVLGMIQAFHAVPLQSSGLKTSLLAAGISKAMVTTASSLIIAIPAQMAYSYFRGRVQQITNLVEIYTTDITNVIEKLQSNGE